MIADHVEEGIGAREVAGAEDGVAVARRRGLGDEAHTVGVAAGGVCVARLLTGEDDDADLLDVGGERLLDEDAEDGLLLAVTIDQGLKRQRALALAGRGDDSFLDAQRGSWRAFAAQMLIVASVGVRACTPGHIIRDMADVKPYRWLAKYYDEFFGPFRAPLDAARTKLLRPVMADVRAACDLACGTGTTALKFAGMGLETYAIDLSPAMCREVRAKARSAGLRVRVAPGDMRTFRLPVAVDLITCESDAVNHVPKKSDLAKVARSASRALRPGGHFLFEVNNRAGFAKYWTGTAWFERPGVVLVMRNGNRAAADKAWSDVEWFVREGSLWRRYQERVEEVCWSLDEVLRVLAGAGFDEVQEWDAAPFFGGEMITPGCRSFYLARNG